MKKTKEITGMEFKKDELGYILWKLESLEDFYPCYNKMIKKE